MSKDKAPGPGGDKEKDKGKGDDNKKIGLIVAVSGEDVEFKAKPDDTLGSIADEALKKTEHLGRPLTDWLLRNEVGELLDMSRTVGSYGLKDGDVLSLTLEAGVAG